MEHVIEDYVIQEIKVRSVILGVSLTEAFLAKAAVAPDETGRTPDRIFYWDDKLTGFGLMVTAKGHRTFVVQYRTDGRSKRMHLKPNLSAKDARTEAKKLLELVAKGQDPIADKQAAATTARRARAARPDTFAAIVDEYFKRGVFKRDGSKLRTLDDRRAVLDRLVIPAFGKRPISDIKRRDITGLLDRIADENGPIMARLVLAYIRKVMNWHAARSDFNTPIIPGMGPLGSTQRDRILSDDELKAVWSATEAVEGFVFGTFVRFLLLTATRRSEAAAMTRDELPDARGEKVGERWVIPSARYKTNKELVIPLSMAAQSALEVLPELGKFIFTTDGQRPIAGFSKSKHAFDKKVLAALRTQDPQAKLARWTLHDLRRTAHSLMSRAGIPPEVAERCLGHTVAGARDTYDRDAFYAEMKHAFEALAGQIDRIVIPPADTGVILQEIAARLKAMIDDRRKG